MGATLLGLALGAEPAAAQRLVDWPVRVSAGAEALVPGAAAAFWNPAAGADGAGRAEVMALEIVGPESALLSGLALAGRLGVGRGTTVVIGYRHVGVEDLTRTSTSPQADPDRPRIEVGEDLFTAGASREIASGLTAGAALHYWRETADTLRSGDAAVGAGLVYRPALPLDVRIGGAFFAGKIDPRWMLGVEAWAPAAEARSWAAGLSYGVSGERWPRRPAHRLAALGAWGDEVAVSLGLDVEPGARRASWEPVAGASLRLGRYLVGVVREELANGFGATYYYRIQIAL